jgi:hypothetical protein
MSNVEATVRSRVKWGWIWARVHGVVHLDNPAKTNYISFCGKAKADVFRTSLTGVAMGYSPLPEGIPVCPVCAAALSALLLEYGRD